MDWTYRSSEDDSKRKIVACRIADTQRKAKTDRMELSGIQLKLARLFHVAVCAFVRLLFTRVKIMVVDIRGHSLEIGRDGFEVSMVCHKLVCSNRLFLAIAVAVTGRPRMTIKIAPSCSGIPCTKLLSVFSGLNCLYTLSNT